MIYEYEKWFYWTKLRNCQPYSVKALAILSFFCKCSRQLKIYAHSHSDSIRLMFLATNPLLQDWDLETLEQMKVF